MLRVLCWHGFSKLIVVSWKPLESAASGFATPYEEVSQDTLMDHVLRSD